MPLRRLGCEVGKRVDRYSLAWASLGTLALAASVSWWLMSTDVSPATQPTVSVSQPLAADGSASGLWHPPPAAVSQPSAAAAPATTLAPAAEGHDGRAFPTATAQVGVLQPGFVAASLQALSGHGVPLHQAQVSLHTVQTADLPAAQALGRWARSQGFLVRPPVKVLEHGGEVTWVLPIERHAVLDVAQILADGQQISSRAQQTPGARYHTWQVPVNGRSTLAGAAQS